ncbi:MAG: ATP-dependent zinc metalloprotease FtsH, partial [Leadbetterella sp.]
VTLAYNDTKSLLIEHRDKLDLLAKELLAREIIYQPDIVELIGERPFAKETVYQEFMNKKDDKPEVTEMDSKPEVEDQEPKTEVES